MPRPKKYHTEEERREGGRQSQRKYYYANRKAISARRSEGQQEKAGGHEGGAEGDVRRDREDPRLVGVAFGKTGAGHAGHHAYWWKESFTSAATTR